MNVLIIGGGLSGLAVADGLQAQGDDYIIAEARDRVGGRIVTEHLDGGYFDMGPAWVWPGQPRIAALIKRFRLEVFEQHTDGLTTVEDTHGQVQQGRGHAAMQGSWRLKGGLDVVTQALARGLPAARLRLSAPVTHIARTVQGVTATLANGDTLAADKVVLAIPPRMAATLAFTPALPASALSALHDIPTWMAGQAKALAVYDTPFWRDAGLSGDAMSRHGPMVEIHDASPVQGGPFGLFGFIGVPPEGRTDTDALRAAVIAQFGRLFGPQATTPRQLYLRDWAFDPFTSVAADKAPLFAHPTYGIPQALNDLWEAQLVFAGTEVAPQFGGYIEGALEAAENALAQVTGLRAYG